MSVDEKMSFSGFEARTWFALKDSSSMRASAMPEVPVASESSLLALYLPDITG